MGITLKTWLNFGRDINNDGTIDVKDLKLITQQDAENILRKYWNKCKGDQIKSQAIANLLVSWYWGSGGIAIKKLQQTLNALSQRHLDERSGLDPLELLSSKPTANFLLTEDGKLGSQTLKALNKANPVSLFYDYKLQKQLYLKQICQQHPKNNVFLRGWLRRLNCIQYNKLICNDGTEIKFEL